jgi:hypothetical protein
MGFISVLIIFICIIPFMLARNAPILVYYFQWCPKPFSLLSMYASWLVRPWGVAGLVCMFSYA